MPTRPRRCASGSMPAFGGSRSSSCRPRWPSSRSATSSRPRCCRPAASPHDDAVYVWGILAGSAVGLLASDARPPVLLDLLRAARHAHAAALRARPRGVDDRARVSVRDSRCRDGSAFRACGAPPASPHPPASPGGSRCCCCARRSTRASVERDCRRATSRSSGTAAIAGRGGGVGVIRLSFLLTSERKFFILPLVLRKGGTVGQD